MPSRVARGSGVSQHSLTGRGLTFLGTPVGVQLYLRSIQDGVNKLRSVLDDSARRCTGTNTEKWIVAGYSQGALVVNKTVRSYAASRFAQIDLIADPDRTRDAVGKPIGSAGPGSGIYSLSVTIHLLPV